MPNPVLSLDLRLSYRRSRFLSLRLLYTLWLALLVAVLGCLWCEWPVSLPSGWDRTALVENFLAIFIYQHFLLLIFAVPAFFCGAITEEKEQGTLALLLTTETTPLGIIVGKFVSRLVQVMGLALVGFPLFCLIGSYLNMLSWQTVLAFLGLSLSVSLALGGFSLWQSVRASETRIASIRVYFVLTVGLALSIAYYHLGVPFLILIFWRYPTICHGLVATQKALLVFEPVSMLEPAWSPADLKGMEQRLLLPCAALLGVGLIFLTWSALILRKAALGPMDAPQNRKGSGPRREPVPEDEPICWREQLRRRHWPHWIAAGVLAIAVTEAHHQVLYTENHWLLTPIWAAAGALLSLPVIVRAAGCVTSERSQRTWESVLSTPFEGWQLVIEKRWGVLRRYSPYFVAFVIPALIVPCFLNWRAMIWALAMLVLWSMVVFYMVSTGVWCSAYSRSSWRSVVATMARGYGFFVAVLTIVALVHLALICMFVPIISFLVTWTGSEEWAEDALLMIGVAGCGYLAWRLYQAAETQIWLAQAWIETHERYGRSFTRSLTRALKKAQARHLGQGTDMAPSVPGRREADPVSDHLPISAAHQAAP